MPLTDRFGFTRFGPGTGGTINDDGGKFTDQDRVTLDRILTAFENHTHSDAAGGVRMPDPTEALEAEYRTTGGRLQGGRTYYYAYTVLDQHGLESAPSPLTPVAVPAPLSTPAAPQVYAHAGGSLLPGTYLYGLTALDTTGDETTLSSPAPVSLLAGDGAARVAMPSSLATANPSQQYQLWRQSPTANGWTRVAKANAGDEVIDDGSVPDDDCACDPAKMPPSVNLTSSTGSVRLVVPQTVRDMLLNSTQWKSKGWRLYRSEVEGVWSGQSLVAEVVATVAEGGGDRVSEFLDTGGDPMFGVPPLVSRALASSAPFTTPVLPPGAAFPVVARPGASVVTGAVTYTYTDTGWVQASIPVVTSLPSGARTGEVYFHDAKLKKWTGSDWEEVLVGGGGGGGTQPVAAERGFVPMITDGKVFTRESSTEGVFSISQPGGSPTIEVPSGATYGAVYIASGEVWVGGHTINGTDSWVTFQVDPHISAIVVSPGDASVLTRGSSVYVVFNG